MRIKKNIAAGIRFMTNSDYRFLILSEFGFFKNMNDEEYLQKRYKAFMKRELNLDNPHTFNEKIQWLKLHDRNPLYTDLVDKIKVKEWVAKTIGEEYVIPTIAVWDDPDEIDFKKLPGQYVLKCNHNSGLGMFISDGKKDIDEDKIRRELRKGLKENKYFPGREWAYKNVKPRILAEKYMEDSISKDLKDYKFFSFNGEVRALFIASERQNMNDETRFDFFDENFEHLDIRNGHPNAEKIIEKPINFEKMKELACILSRNIPQVRVDFYEVDGKVYFGEMTFYHWSGMVPFEPEEWDEKFGDWLVLPIEKGIVL